MSKEKIKAIMSKANKEDRQLTPDEVKEIKTLEAVKETASQDPNKPAPADKAPADKAPADKAPADKAPADKAPADKAKKQKKVKVKFLYSPSSGPFKLGYHVGDVVVLPVALAAELIKANFAKKA